MKLTLDTNILVSATFWYGDSYTILEMAEKGRFEIVLSSQIIAEFFKVLNSKEINEKIRDKNLEIRMTFNKMMQLAKIVIPHEKFSVITADMSDNIILECAKAGNVDFIITQDNHLLNLKSFQGIKILLPEEFLEKYIKK